MYVSKNAKNAKQKENKKKETKRNSALPEKDEETFNFQNWQHCIRYFVHLKDLFCFSSEFRALNVMYMDFIQHVIFL